jgi:hypothetical protein
MALAEAEPTLRGISMRTALAVTLAMAVVAYTDPRPAAIAPEPLKASAALATQQQGSIPASLLARLAEAADGYRDNRDRYVVAAIEFPHEVAGVFLNKANADAVADKRTTPTKHFKTFGPYRTPVEAGISPEIDNVDSVVVYYTSETKKTYDGKEYDALFWGIASFDKFVAPYLTQVSGAHHADSLRELYKAGRLSHSVLPHYRYSF